jgi:ElaB/YqjD/DUF883 family membrane-anchored ribosome-binding protein
MTRHNHKSNESGHSPMARTAQAITGSMDCALDNLRTGCQRMEEEAVACIRGMDRTVHEHPYSALGAGFGLGLLIGLLLPWK